MFFSGDQGGSLGLLRLPGQHQPHQRPQDVHRQAAGEAVELKENHTSPNFIRLHKNVKTCIYDISNHPLLMSADFIPTFQFGLMSQCLLIHQILWLQCFEHLVLAIWISLRGLVCLLPGGALLPVGTFFGTGRGGLS